MVTSKTKKAENQKHWLNGDVTKEIRKVINMRKMNVVYL